MTITQNQRAKPFHSARSKAESQNLQCSKYGYYVCASLSKVAKNAKRA